MGDAPRMANVTNRLEDGSISAADDLHTLDLTGNQLWHTDSIFLPVPAIVNVLAARVLSSTGGSRVRPRRPAPGRRDLPGPLRERLDGAVLSHRLAHSRRGISAELVERHRSRFDDQRWTSTWTNPSTGERALYLASHTYAVDGDESDEAQALIDDTIAWCTTDRVYTMNGGWATCSCGTSGRSCTTAGRGRTTRSARSRACARRPPRPTAWRASARRADQRRSVAITPASDASASPVVNGVSFVSTAKINGPISRAISWF